MDYQGSKFDNNKTKYHLVPLNSIEGIAKVLTKGAEKYGEYNWTKGIEPNRLYSACMRHLIEHMRGNIEDQESKLPHIYHAITNLVMMAELQNIK